jgi:hypothetical protein
VAIVFKASSTVGGGGENTLQDKKIACECEGLETARTELNVGSEIIAIEKHLLV